MSTRRTFTESERTAILREVDEHGLSVTIRKHKLTASLIYKWRNRTAADASPASKESEQELRRMRQEVQQLKELVAEKELTIRIKDTLLKKNVVAREDRMTTACDYIGNGAPRNLVLHAVGLARSTFYYRPVRGRRGRHATDVTYDAHGRCYDNDELLAMIRGLLNQEFVDYGYVKVTRWLQRKGLVINRKKVLRLMRSHGLLLARPRRPGCGKTWVKELLPVTRHPFDYLEFDIKYIRIDGTGRNAMLLTAIDVLSRCNVGHLLQWSIRKEDVVELFDGIFARYPLPSQVAVRSDNGSQFESGLVTAYFVARGIAQEFTRPATPEQNAHIEGYHSVVQRAVCDAKAFDDLDDAQATFDRFRTFYNDERLHSGIGYRTPSEVLASYGKDMLTATSAIPQLKPIYPQQENIPSND